MIAVKNLSKLFRTDEVETTALSDVNLTIEGGEFVAIMGPSGCGKSTLLNVLGLLDNPTQGSYQLLGQEVAELPERKRSDIRKRNIGFVFQNYNLIDELTISENIELPLAYQKVARSERKIRVEELLRRFDLIPRSNHFPQQLSGGQQQRAAVARAVVSKPKLVLADEPTGNLDSERGNEVMDALVALNATGTTIVVVTHSATYASYAKRTVNLFDGSVVAEQKGGVGHVG
jgi:putative ABC transport system ATP-binding protein